MNQKKVTIILYFIVAASFALSFYFFGSDIHLSLTLFSGVMFFLFLAKNPKLLMATDAREIDQVIPNMKGKFYFYSSLATLCIGNFLLFVIY